MDVQHLILRTLGGPQFNAKTRWCRLLRPAKLKLVVILFLKLSTFLSSSVVIIVVEQMDKETSTTFLKKTACHFDSKVDIDSSLTHGCSVLDELVYAPVTQNRLAKVVVNVCFIL